MDAKYDWKLIGIVGIVVIGWTYHLGFRKSTTKNHTVNENPLVDDSYYAYDHLAPVDMLSYKQHVYTQSLDKWWCSQAQNEDIGRSQFRGVSY